MSVDTLKLYERFRKTDLSEAASKEIAEAIKETSDEIASGLATKQDIDLKIEVLRKEISDLRAELIKWMLGIGIAGFTAVIGLLKILKVI